MPTGKPLQPAKAWSPSEDARLRQLYPTLPRCQVSSLLRRTEMSIKSRAHVLGLTRGTQKPWTEKQDALLRELYPTTQAEAIARLVGHPLFSTLGRAKKLGLKKPVEWVAATTRERWQEGRHQGSRRSHFQKGRVSHNKGVRRPGYAAGRMGDTQFKKGRPAQETHNYVPIGAEKVSPQRNALLRKVTDDPSIVPAQRWRPVHTLVWIEVYGAVPEGSIVVFRPGMKTLKSSEITIDRLELVTLAEHMKRNTIQNYPPAMKDAMRLVGRVKRQARKRDGEESD